MVATGVCRFCADTIVDAQFLESTNFRAIYNIGPILPGRSLIIPKKHTIGLLELSDDELYEMVKFSRDTLKILTRAYDVKAFNWTIQCQ